MVRIGRSMVAGACALAVMSGAFLGAVWAGQEARSNRAVELHQAATRRTAPFYRFWRGFKREDLPAADFFRRLIGEFMPATVQTHGHEGLLAYLVALPPASGTKTVPDEIALVAYESEAVYRRLTQTPHGKAYQQKHWEIFARGVSKSLVPQPFDLVSRREFKGERAFDVLNSPVDWQEGTTAFFLGFRKPSLRPDFFHDALYNHVRYVRSAFVPLGLKGYLVLVTNDAEIALLNWESQEAMDRAMSSPAGQAMVRDAQGILDFHMYKNARPFAGSMEVGEFVTYPFVPGTSEPHKRP